MVLVLVDKDVPADITDLLPILIYHDAPADFINRLFKLFVNRPEICIFHELHWTMRLIAVQHPGEHALC